MRYDNDGDGLQCEDVLLAEAVSTTTWQPPSDCEDIDDLEFCDLLLAGLVTMAAKSKRRQADIDAVLLRAQLTASPDRMRMALRQLEDGSCIRDLVPLYDGGMLVTVTNIGMDTMGRTAHWRFLRDANGHHV